MIWHLRGTVAAALAACSVTAAAQEAEGPARVAIEYDAPLECPDVDGFVQALQARTNRAEQVAPELADQTFQVEIGADDIGGYQGDLALVVDGRVTGRRHVDGASCQEVVDALGLAAALSVDPEALVREPPRPTPAPEPPNAEGSGADSNDAGDQPTTRPPETPPPPWNVLAGAHGALFVALRPVAFMGGDVFVGVGRDVSGPDIRLSATWAVGRNENAQYRWMDFTLSVCPREVSLGSRVDFWPCGLAGLGSLRGEGRKLASVAETERLTAELGVGGRLQLDLTRHLYGEASGLLLVPLAYRDFVVDEPERSTGETPVVIPGARIGLGLRL